jgi:aquaporin Z
MAELTATLILVFAVLSAVTLAFHRGSAVAKSIPSVHLRLLLIGLFAAAIFIGLATSPIGRRSGAHLNPAVTLAFWITGHVHRHDLAGFSAAQLAGAVLGVLLLRLVWGSDAASVDYGAIHPTVTSLHALWLEGLMTGGLVLTVFVLLSSPGTVRWTPIGAGVIITLAIWLGATSTGTGINPARTLAANIGAGDFRSWWVYLLGPVLGVVTVAFAWRFAPRVLLTAKLFHDPRYPSVFRTHLPVRPRGNIASTM